MEIQVQKQSDGRHQTFLKGKTRGYKLGTAFDHQDVAEAYADDVREELGLTRQRVKVELRIYQNFGPTLVTEGHVSAERAIELRNELHGQTKKEDQRTLAELRHEAKIRNNGGGGESS